MSSFIFLTIIIEQINNKNIRIIFYMINYLQNCQKSTPIGMVPDIINHNNQAISNEFDWIYDVAADRLTKSVYAPTGSVKAHKGEFVNLSCEYITIKNSNTLSNYIHDIVNDIVVENTNNHNSVSGRFSGLNSEVYENTSYCHDAASIAFNETQSVFDILDDIDKGNLVIRYGDEVYTSQQIASLLDWKKRLRTESLVIVDSMGVATTYNVLCEA